VAGKCGEHLVANQIRVAELRFALACRFLASRAAEICEALICRRSLANRAASRREALICLTLTLPFAPKLQQNVVEYSSDALSTGHSADRRNVARAMKGLLMTQIVTAHGGYRKMLSFGFTCLVYHATTTFCRRNFNYRNDSLGKTTGQMVGAARSARQNIVEGSVRSGTSKETELRLLDVAKASLAELAGDYEAFLIDRNEIPWSDKDPRALRVRETDFEPFTGDEDKRHAFGCHLLDMRRRFSSELESEDAGHAANAILIVIDRASALLHRQIEKIERDFKAHGGFSERLNQVRMGTQEEDDMESPRCPTCGGAMRKVIARKGANAGRPFWSCRAYPECKGSRPWVS